MHKPFLLFILCTSSIVYGQGTMELSSMQGIWECSVSDGFSVFKIINGKNCLEFTSTSDSTQVDFPLFKMIVGFQNYIEAMDADGLRVSIDSIKESGLYYTEIINEKYIDTDGFITKPDFLVPYYFACDGQMMSIGGGKLFEFEKILKLPYTVVQALYYRGKRDKYDYFKEFTGQVTTSLKKKCNAYTQPKKSKPLKLNNKTVLVIIEYRGDWVKVNYQENQSVWIWKTELEKSSEK